MGNYIKTIVNYIIVCSLYVERLLVEFNATAAVVSDLILLTIQFVHVPRNSIVLNVIKV